MSYIQCEYIITDGNNLIWRKEDSHPLGIFLTVGLNYRSRFLYFLALSVTAYPENWIASGWFLFSLILVTLFGLFLTNFLLMLRASRIEEQTKKKYTDQINESDSLHNLETNNLKSQISELEKKARYAEIFPMLNVAFQELHSAVRKNHVDKAKYHEHLVVCCHNLEKAFSTITNADCHVSIKMTQFPHSQIPPPNKANKNIPNILLRTYCRSSSSSSIRGQIGLQEKYENIQ